MSRRKARQTQARWRRTQYAMRRDLSRCVDCNRKLKHNTARCPDCAADNCTRTSAARAGVWDRVYGLTEDDHAAPQED